MAGSIPSKQADQVAWAANLADVVGTDPEPYGVPIGIMTEFADANTALQAAWAVTQNPGTRTPVTIELKDLALQSMVVAGRRVIAAIRATPTVTSAMLIAAGITVPKGHRTPAPVPGTSPIVKITRTVGRTATVELLQAADKRGKPERVDAAIIFTFTGPAAPFDPSEWQFATLTGHTTVDIPFPPSATGDTVWITASWVNDRKETGPAATPVSLNLPAAGGLPTEVNEAPVRLAA